MTLDTDSETRSALMSHTSIAPRARFVPRQRSAIADHRRLGGSAEPTDLVAGAMTVLIADPVPSSRERLATELAAGGAGQVIQADSVRAVEILIENSTGGQLALVSLGFGDPAPRLIRGLAQVPWTRVLAVALSRQPEPLLAALAAGATGVLRGHPGGADPDLSGRLGRLTARELDVLRLVAEGRTNKWIAEQLSLSALTVKSHLARISRKLGTGDRSHQVAVAMRAGMMR
jgi:DNA-binding NarL/FixJ family response regulator